jgi:Major Facilitator Superfamily
MRKIPQGAGLYLAVLELVFALGWTVYAIYLPRLAASAGIAAGAVIYILMLDQAIFTVTDFAMGVAADKVSRLVGRLGHWVAAITALSCAAFVALPYVAGTKLGPTALLVLIVIWAVTSSALRAPPLMLLGKYAARPTIPYLASLAMLGLGIAGAVSPYLAITLAKQDPRLPFVIASVALVLASLGLAKVERSLAKDAPPKPEPPKNVDRAVPLIVFALATVIFAFGFQLHFFFNSAPRFKQFASDISTLMPVFWVGFSIGMFPASLITKRWGGLPVMGLFGIIGAVAIVVMEYSGRLEVAIAAQLIAGAAWGCILMSAFSAAAALGYTGAEGKTTGALFSALALATFVRMATTASGALNDPSLAPLLHWAPVVCWAIGGAMLLLLSIARMRRAIK